MKNKLILAGLLTTAFVAKAQYVSTSGTAPSGTQVFMLGNGGGSLHSTTSGGVLIRSQSGDRALLELQNPWGTNRTVFQAHNSATYLDVSLATHPFYLMSSGSKISIGHGNVPSYHVDLRTSGANDGLSVTQTSNTAAALHLTGGGGKHWALFSTGSSSSEGANHFSIYDYGSSTDRFFINGSNGNVGIGTIYTDKKLTVDGDVSIGRGYSSSGFGSNGIEILGAGQVPVRRGISTDANPNGNFEFYVNNYQSGTGLPEFRFKNGIQLTGANINAPATASTNAPDLMTIDGLGKVTINSYSTNTTASPDALVIKDVQANTVNFKVKKNGNVYAREMWVQTGTFPDYVFSKNYKLLSLAELENYISDNHHLPNVPTEKEVVENGMNVGQISIIQMEKIEELTLYIIELKKEMNELKQQVNKSSNKNLNK